MASMLHSMYLFFLLQCLLVDTIVQTLAVSTTFNQINAKMQGALFQAANVMKYIGTQDSPHNISLFPYFEVSK